MISKGQYLGEFEELVLVSAATLLDDAYGVSIMHYIESGTGRTVNISAVHEVLRRLERKGYVRSKMGGATAERGGRRKRYYRLTAAGTRVLEATIRMRMELYQRLPDISIKTI